MLSIIKNYFKNTSKKPQNSEETIVRNIVYTVRDVIINGEGLLTIVYFKNNNIEILTENKKPLLNDIVFIYCHRATKGPALLKHSSTTTKTSNNHTFSVVIEKYDLYLPDSYDIKGAK